MQISKSSYRSRREAAAASSPRFYTGRPCKWGHDAERFTCNGGCVDCLNPKLARPVITGGNVHTLHVAFPAFRLVNGKPVECPPPSPEAVAYVQQWLLQNVRTIVDEFEAQRAAKVPRVLVPTDKTMGTPLDEFRAKGWTDAQLVQHGYAA